MICELEIDNEEFSFRITGDFAPGPDEVLFAHDGLLENVPWKDKGYEVITLFSQNEFIELEKNILRILNRILEVNGLGQISQLEAYHRVVDTDQKHQQVISRTRFLTSADFQIDLKEISERISRHLSKEVGIENPLLDEEIIILRISRPDSLDINPLHRDGYLDIWENTINVWIPLAGCNRHSSLPVIPGSHLWNEQDVLRTPAKNAVINGNTYHVPGIVGGPVKLKAVRPDPGQGQALLFTPFLVHGAAINQNPDRTRMSLEFRLCGKQST